MSNTFARLSGAFAASVMLAACSSTDAGSNPAQTFAAPTDQNFIVGATQSSNAEISAAQLTLQKSANADVRAFAQEMITQHTQQEQALTPIATSVNYPPPPPTSLNPMQQQTAATLAATPEPAYDGVYINTEIVGHTANLANNFNPEVTSGKNTQVVAYAQTYLPQVQMHLTMAQQLKAKYGF